MIELQYIPDVDRLIEVYEEVIDTRVSDEWKNNPYFKFLKQHGFIVISNDRVERSSRYDFSSKGKAYNSIISFLKSWGPSRLVMDRLSIGADSLEELQREFDPEMSADSLRVILAWMEQLGLVENSGNGYIHAYDSIPDNEESLSIYPLKYEKALNITDARFSVFEYLRRINQGVIDIHPNFQRKEIWNDVQKSRFIESAILNIPIPPLYFKKMTDARLVIVDGLQRTATLMDFIENKFRLTGLEALDFLNGKSFSDLVEDKEGYASRIEDKQLDVYILGTDVSMPWVYDIFNRINTGGTKLERQEIRNCVYIGKSTELLKFLANSDAFKQAVDNGISDRRMKAREAILRCLAFVLFGTSEYQGSIDQFLEMAMKRINAMSSQEVEDLKKQTLRTFEITTNLFGDKNFRIPSGSSRGRINVAVMEAVFHCFWNKTDSVMQEKLQLSENFDNLVRDSEFIESFRNSTSSKSGVKERFRLAHKYLDNAPKYLDYD